MVWDTGGYGGVGGGADHSSQLATSGLDNRRRPRPGLEIRQVRGMEVRGAEVRGVEVRGVEVRGSEFRQVRGMEVRGIEVRGSEVRQVRGMEVRGSEVRGSEVRQIRGMEVRGTEVRGVEVRQVRGMEVRGAEVRQARGAEVREAEVCQARGGPSQPSGGLGRPLPKWVAVTAYPYVGGRVWYQCSQEQENTPPRSWRDSTPPPRTCWTECLPRSSWREGTPPPPSSSTNLLFLEREPLLHAPPGRMLPPRGQIEYAPPPRAWRQSKECSPPLPYQTQSPLKRPRSTNSGWGCEEDQ
ncbi:hypothetical protein ACOMHN_013198 [Nucella lapillus]